MSAAIKLEVLQVAKKNPKIDPSHLQDTAEVLEELMQAVEIGHKGPNLPDRKTLGGPAKEEIKNKALEDKEVDMAK